MIRRTVWILFYEIKLSILKKKNANVFIIVYLCINIEYRNLIIQKIFDSLISFGNFYFTELYTKALTRV